MASRCLLCCLLALSVLSVHVRAIVIDVYRNGKHVMKYTDDTAESEDRAGNIPDASLRGQMYYAVPYRNACQPIERANETHYNWIALIDNYFECPDDVAWNLFYANYGMMLAYSPTRRAVLYSTPALPSVIFTHSSFLEFLKNNTIMGISPNASEYHIKVSLTSWAFYEKLFMIFGAVLLTAVSLSIVIFCGSVFCRTVLQRWHTRGLSRWRVRQLPKRKYKKGKEVCESCSICLEDFKTGDHLRVLPCDHIFHPSCVDEWLQKWNRTCPLCKSTIQRRKRGVAMGVANRPLTGSSSTASPSDQEHARLLAHEERVGGSSSGRGGGATVGESRDQESYGATGYLAVPLSEAVTAEESEGGRGRLSVSVTLEVPESSEQEANLREQQQQKEGTVTTALEEQA